MWISKRNKEKRKITYLVADDLMVDTDGEI